MGYEKIIWDYDVLITPGRLRHMETQYEEAVKYINFYFRFHPNREIRAQTSQPTPEIGRVYTGDRLYGWDGEKWVVLGGTP